MFSLYVVCMTACVPNWGINNHFVIYQSLKDSRLARLVFVISWTVHLNLKAGIWKELKTEVKDTLDILTIPTAGEARSSGTVMTVK